jgi:hypothetical protein
VAHFVNSGCSYRVTKLESVSCLGPSGNLRREMKGRMRSQGGL